ncbi:uncharacterized protein VICG_01218 [Vittaforma corneae ATCC 50505]|uniref:C3H1-type domain-containing protein n=1 Tax=Vittaforma corneae (strain ATCC 50505) TaxID=993615 RepID=L2GM61_VITCO|nr:uncharacterized protein VICG_01218 [Vittaforma corneae ATCC 50505]ELA41714.1 hypothetical protein VICG_01218 [Vittaforma corneae ATCC 50505]
MRNFGAKKFINNQSNEGANNIGVQGVSINVGAEYGAVWEYCGSKNENFDANDQVNQNFDQIHDIPENEPYTTEDAGEVEMKGILQCDVSDGLPNIDCSCEITQEYQHSPSTKNEQYRHNENNQHHSTYNLISKSWKLEKLDHSSVDSNPIIKHIPQEPKAIFSKKFIENPLVDERVLYQNKRVILYKTEMCRSFSEVGFCKYGDRCQFCHSPSELRTVKRHPKYKTEICKTFWNEGNCPYGSRCCFIHLEKVSNNIDSFSDGSSGIFLLIILLAVFQIYIEAPRPTLNIPVLTIIKIA